jgi:hypothetical protein
MGGWCANARYPYASGVLRVWLKLLSNSFGTALVVAAAQVAIAEATGILAWNDVGTADRWRTTLTWIAFIYLVGVLAGADIGRRAMRRRGARPESMRPLVVATVAAAIGSAVAGLVAGLPASGAHPPVSVHPDLVVATTAGVAIAAGAVLALVAGRIPAVATNMRAFVGLTWLLALACAAAGMLHGGSYPAPRPGYPDAPSLIARAWWSGSYVIVAGSVLIGVVVAIGCRLSGRGRLGLAISGAFGPAVLAIAYMINRFEPATLIAIGAGLAASALIAVPGRPAKARPQPAPRTATAPEEPEAPPAAATPTPAPAGRIPKPPETPPAPSQALPGHAARSDLGGAPPRSPWRARASASVPVTAPLMGRPPRTAEEEYAEWLGGLNGPRGDG